MLIKVDNRETELYPLIERRIDSIDILEKDSISASAAAIKNKVTHKGQGQGQGSSQ